MSSAKTPNLGLNQWSGDDYVIREEFNADNAIIDAALADVGGIELIKEVTTSANVAQVDLDVTDIDWAKYHEVYLDVISPVDGDTLSTIFMVRFNNSDSTSAYKYVVGTTNQANPSFVATIFYQSKHNKRQRLVFTPYKSSDDRVACSILNYGTHYMGQAKNITYNDLNTINIVVTEDPKPIRKSTVFRFWGLK